MMEVQAALTELQQAHNLSILTLAHPLLHPADESTKRDSSSLTSTDSDIGTLTPALLEADLQHYRELFSKLRFSYVEQVTKEKFLQAITSDPPEFVDASENLQLEERLKGEKEALKRKKEEVAELVQEVGEQSRALAQRYEQVQVQSVQLESLPAEIESLQEAIVELRTAQRPKPSVPWLSIPLQPTLSLLDDRERELSDVDAEIEQLSAALPARRQEVERLHDDLEPLRLKKDDAVKEAQLARRQRAGGATGDELEEKGRWLRGVDASLRAMLEV